MKAASLPVESLANRFSTIYPLASSPAQVLKLFHSNSPEAFKEAEMHRTAAALTTGVVGFVETYIKQGQLGIVMEACQWGNLGETVTEGLMGWSEKELLLIGRSMMRIVKSLHDNGIAHCDLGLENWLVSRKNTLKVTDFGSAESIPVLFDAKDSRFGGDNLQIGKNLYKMTFFKPCRYDKCALDVLLLDITTKAKKKGYSEDLAELISVLLGNQQSLERCIDFTEEKIERK